MPVILAQEMPGIVIALLIVAIFAVIVVVVILIKKHVKAFKSDEQPKSDKEIAAEELDRLLEPVEELEPKTEEKEEEGQGNGGDKPEA